MKKFYLSILLIAATFTAVFAQVPNTFNYQAVVRNASGEILANKTVSFRISLLKNTETGDVVYSETHSLSTNNFGLVNLKIGGGAILSGTFSPENWGEVIFTKVELDPEGGSSFSHLATTKLSSVPFAFMAQTVVNDKVNDADADPTNEIQLLSLDGTLLELSNGGGSVTLPVSGGDGGDNWGAQSVITDASLTGDGTSGSPLSVVADGDGDDSNELQTLSINENNLTLSDGGSTVTLPASPWNETTSQINYIGSKNVYISDGGGSALKTKSGSMAEPSKFGIYTEGRSAIDIYTESSIYPAIDVWNEEGIAAKFNNNSDKPVAVFENYDVGLAAQFNNKIQIADGTQGDGKVLTSDADGITSWQAPAAVGGSSLWTESGSNVYRASGKVGIGTSNPIFMLDIQSSETAPIIAVKAASSLLNAHIIVDRGNSSGYGDVIFRTAGTNKFYAGLDGTDNFRISTLNSSLNGLEVETDGDVNMSDDLHIDGDLFVNQNMEVADDLSVGSITISGSEIQKSSTGSANMITHAYGFVTLAGTLKASSGNVSVVRSALGKYTVTITGETYSDDNYVAVFSHGHSMKSLGHEESSGKINVYITTNSDDLYADAPFSFIIYKM